MRIAQILSGFPTISQTFVLNQIAGLIDRGYGVDIYAAYKERGTIVQAEVSDYNLLNRTNFCVCSPNKVHRVVKGLIGCFRHIWRDPTPIVSALDFPKYGMYTLSMFLLHDALAALDGLYKSNYDIIHAQFGLCGIRALFLKNIGTLRGRLITSIRGADITRVPNMYGCNFYDELFEQGDVFLPVSHSLKRRLIDLGCPPEKIIVHHSGIDISKFAFRLNYPYETDPIRLLTIGRLVEKKGIEYGIRAVTRVAKQNNGREILYTVIGDGPLRSDLEQLVSSLGLGESIRFTGQASHDEVLQALNESHLLLAPSITSRTGDQEGIPNVIKEAMAIGVPVISTYHSGIPEIIQNGNTGLLVAERDVEGLARKIEYLLANRELWARVSYAARGDIEKHFCIGKLNNELIEIYKSVCI